MATAEKNCKACGATFSRNPRYSAAQWGKAEFCSNACRGETLRIERALCGCGCGERVAKPHSRWRQGHNRQPDRKVLVYFDGRRFFVRDRAGHKVYWYRVLMMAELGRELRDGETVHHLNGDRTDDRIENLRLYQSHADHMRDEYRAGNLPAMR
jgi:hypothetical protein